MTEESEHYMDHPRVHNRPQPYWILNPKVHKSLATLLDPESEGTQVACNLIGSITWHTR
jgi:hypothetical protein